MKRSAVFLPLLFLLSLLSGWLLSRISQFGRFGVNMIYHQYRFLKSWWKDWLLVLGVWLAVYALHALLAKRLSKKAAIGAHVISAMLAIAGLLATYRNFHSDITHHWLGDRFHLGAYLFWLGWVSIPVFFLLQPGRQSEKQVKIAQ